MIDDETAVLSAIYFCQGEWTGSKIQKLIYVKTSSLCTSYVLSIYSSYVYFLSFSFSLPTAPPLSVSLLV